VAYTTLMTTLDRLFRKGTLSREKSGRAFFYRPKSTPQELVSELAGSTFATLLPGDAAFARPILSMFVETVGERDEALLDDLEQLVKTRRDELKGRSK
jgi:predicted transcriptional regulator